MKLIIGLGNPGPEYKKTRHNTGFWTVDHMAGEFGADSQKIRGSAILTEVRFRNEKIVLAKPLTFMNRSGFAVRELVSWYKIGPQDLLIIYDDMDLPCGKLRLRRKGSAGSHNGMKSVVEQLGTQEFPRLRIGIGRPPGPMDPIAFVLGKFTEEEQTVLEQAVMNSTEAVKIWAAEGFEKMQLYVNNLNAVPAEEQPAEEAKDE